MKRFFVISFLLTISIALSACDTSLKDYKPNNEDEKQIVSLLNTFCDACNSGDLQKIESVFHNDGVFNSVRGGQVTRSQIAEKNPEWFSVAGKIKLKNPKFKIDSDNAIVTVQAKHGNHYTTGHRFTLTKENDRWLIMEFK